MKFLKGSKRKMLLHLYSLAIILLGVRLAFFLKDGTSNLVEGILIKVIAVVSAMIVAVIIYPTDMKLRTFINKYKALIFVSIIIFVFEIVFIIQSELEITFNTIFSILFMISCIIVIARIIPRTLKRVYLIMLLILFPLYLSAQHLYLNIFNDFFSFNEIVTLGEGVEFSEGFVKFELVHGIFAILVVASVYLFVKFEQDVKIKMTKKNLKILYVPLMFFVLLNLNAEYPVKSARLHTSDHYLYYKFYSHKKFVSRYGGSNYIVRDFFASVVPSRSNKNDIETIETFFSENEKNHEPNEYTGIYKDKNLVFIAAESFDGIAINETLTPNIYKLMSEGINFNNHFVPVYPRTTCDSEIIYNTGLIPSVSDGPTCYMFNQNSYNQSLANIFDEADYTTGGFHSNDKEFYTRYLVYEGFGYDAFYGQHELELSESEKRFDSIFYEKGKEYMVPARDEDDASSDKFMSFIVTLSGHSPYKMSNLAINKHYDTVNEYYGDTVSDEVKYYIAAQIEVDLLVGELLKDLEEKGRLEDTVILFTSDHYPYTMTSSEYENHTEISDDYLKMQSPLIIWSMDTEHKEIDKLTSSFDVLPTLANLFGLEVDYDYYFGHDVFTDNYTPLVIYKDYSWYDGQHYVLYGNSTGEDVDQDYIDQTTNSVDEYFDISRKILRLDYFNEEK